jgi:hypothetical protein
MNRRVSLHSAFPQKTTYTNYYTVTVNVVSTFLLALLILPKLQETGRQFNITPTLTIVSSEVHYLTAVSSSPLDSSILYYVDDLIAPRTQVRIHLRHPQRRKGSEDGRPLQRQQNARSPRLPRDHASPPGR